MAIVRENDKLIINSVKELSVKDIKKYAEQGIKQVEIKGLNYTDEVGVTTMFADEPYEIEKFKIIREKLDELVSGIPKDEDDLKKFAMVYKRVGTNITYDYKAGYGEKESETLYKSKNVVNSRNLSNGLLQGKSVCAGYADILRAALEMVEMNACMVWGRTVYNSKEELLKKYENREKEDYDIEDIHGWVKVEIDGKWYNADATWDSNILRNFKCPENALQTDKEIFFCRKIDSPGPECNTEFSENKMKELFDEIYKQEKKISIENFTNKCIKLYKNGKELFKNKIFQLKNRNKLLLKLARNERKELLKNEDYLKEFESLTGYSINDLKKLGISVDQIVDNMPDINLRTGELIGGKEGIERIIKEQDEKIEELKENTGEKFENIMILYEDNIDEIKELFINNSNKEEVAKYQKELIDRKKYEIIAEGVFGDKKIGIERLEKMKFNKEDINNFFDFLLKQDELDYRGALNKVLNEKIYSNTNEIKDFIDEDWFKKVDKNYISDVKPIVNLKDNVPSIVKVWLENSKVFTSEDMDNIESNATKEKIKSWDLENYGTTKEEVKKKTKENFKNKLEKKQSNISKNENKNFDIDEK